MNEKRSITLREFTILGNPSDRRGNPTPYTRTLRGKYRTDAKRYGDWCDYVRACFLDANHDNTGIGRYRQNIARGKKPIVLGNLKAEMHLRIEWSNNAHGDPDNIFKGIADALFENDKNLDGSFTSKLGEPTPDGRRQGKVTATITVHLCDQK